MPLAPLDLFVAVKADLGSLRCRLDGLAIDTPGGWLGLASQTAALPLAQGFHEVCPDAITPPALKIAIDRAPGAECWGDHPPLAAGLIEVEYAVDDPPHVARGTSASPRSPGSRRQ
jgi:hypothetical protein